MVSNLHDNYADVCSQTSALHLYGHRYPVAHSTKATRQIHLVQAHYSILSFCWITVIIILTGTVNYQKICWFQKAWCHLLFSTILC